MGDYDMKYNRLYIFFVIFCMQTMHYVHAMHSQAAIPEKVFLLGPSTNYTPMNITQDNQKNIYLLAQEKKSTFPAIFKLLLSGKGNGRLDTTKLGFWKQEGSLAYIHAMGSKLFAIVKHAANQDANQSKSYSIHRTNLNSWAPGWTKIYPPEGKETNKLIRLSGDSTQKIWVTFKDGHDNNARKSFFISDASTFFSTRFNRSQQESFDYFTVDEKNNHEWAIDTKKAHLTYDGIAQLLEQNPEVLEHIHTLYASPDGKSAYGINTHMVYAWNAKTTTLEPCYTSSVVDIIPEGKSTITILDADGSIYTVSTKKRAPQRIAGVPISSKISSIPANLTTSSASSSMSFESSSSSQEGEEKKEESVAPSIAPSPTINNKKLDISTHPSTDSESIQHSTSSSETTPSSPSSGTQEEEELESSLLITKSPEPLLSYIQQTEAKLGPKPNVSSLETSPLGKAVYSTTGLSLLSSAAAYYQGYGSLMNVLKYPLAASAFLATPVVLYDFYQKHQLNQWNTDQEWVNNLQQLNKKLSIQPQEIASKKYFFSRDYRAPNNLQLDHENYEFYLMPTDANLSSTFTSITNKLKGNATINYIALQPAPGVTYVGTWPFNVILPRIIVSTNLPGNNNATISDANKILTLLKEKTANTESIRYQPSFSHKVNDLIYYSRSSFTHNKNIYDHASYPTQIRLRKPLKPKKEISP